MAIKKTIAVFGPNGMYLSHCTWDRATALLESNRAVKINATTIKLKHTKKERTEKKREIIAESMRVCYICNIQIPDDEVATIDHIIPKSRSRQADIYSNMRCCCSRCNNDKGNMTLSEYVQHIFDNKDFYKYISTDRLKYLKDFAESYEKEFYSQVHIKKVKSPYKNLYRENRRKKRK